MIIEDICRVKLDKKSMKFICDILINDYITKGVDRRSVRELHNTKLSDLDDNMLSKYLLILKFDPIAQKSFSDDYKELESIYKTEGCKGVLRSTSTLEDLCRKYFTHEKKLFGDKLESAIRIQVDYISDNFSISAWDEGEYGSCISLLKSRINTWVDRATVTAERVLGADISNIISTADREGVDTSIIDEVSTFTVSKGYSDMLDSELYTRLISSIKKGTKLLFPLSSSSSIRGEIYSILNYYYEIEYKQYCKRITEMSQEKKFDVNDVTPHKQKYNTILREGHLVVIDPSYASSGIGNLDNCNKTVNSGKDTLKDYIEAIEYVKGKLSPNEEPVACLLTMDVIRYLEDKNPINIGRLDFVKVVIIIDAIICAEHLINILKENGLSITKFPIIEVREGTWTRFSCLYELVNFYRTHARMGDLNKLNLTNREYAKLRTSPINILDIINRQQNVETSSFETYLEANFSKLQLDNRCSISSLRKDDSRLNFNQTDSLSKVTYVYIQTLYISGKSLIHFIQPYYCDEDFLFAMELFSAIYIPILSRANVDLACCDFHQTQLLNLLSIGNGSVLGNIISDQIDYLDSLASKKDFSQYSDEITQYILALNNIDKKKADYKAFFNILDLIDERMFNIVNKHNELKVFFDDNSRLSKGMYLIYCNVKLSEFLFAELNDVITTLLDLKPVDIINGDAGVDFNKALDNHDNNMLKLLLNITKYKKCKVFYETDIDVIFNEFVEWLSNDLGMRIASKSRLKDFSMYDIFECNSTIIHNMNLIIHEFIKCIEQKLMTKLSKNLDRGIQENYWNSVKDRVSMEFIKHSRDKLAESLYDNTYNSDIDIIEDLSQVPTLRNSTIIGLNEPFKSYLRDGGDYYVYSSLGYKMLLKSRLGVVENMTDEDVNLILSNNEWR